MFRGRAYSGRMLDVGGGIGLLNLVTGAGPIIYIIYMYITLPKVTVSLTFSCWWTEHSPIRMIFQHSFIFQQIKQSFSINFYYFTSYEIDFKNVTQSCNGIRSNHLHYLHVHYITYSNYFINLFYAGDQYILLSGWNFSTALFFSK